MILKYLLPTHFLSLKPIWRELSLVSLVVSYTLHHSVETQNYSFQKNLMQTLWIQIVNQNLENEIEKLSEQTYQQNKECNS